MSSDSVQAVLNNWLECGDDTYPDDPRIPMHPEFYLRKRSSWHGWNVFFDTAESSPDFNDHLRSDEIESQAWAIYEHIQIEAERILNVWLERGKDRQPDDNTKPLHPEYIFRVSGTWQGWNNFNDTPVDSVHFETFMFRDKVEDMAWILYEKPMD